MHLSIEPLMIGIPEDMVILNSISVENDWKDWTRISKVKAMAWGDHGHILSAD